MHRLKFCSMDSNNQSRNHLLILSLKSLALSPYIHDIFYMDIDGTSIFGINNLSSEEFNKLIIFIVILFLVHVCVLSSKYNKNFFSFFFIYTGIIYIYIFIN